MLEDNGVRIAAASYDREAVLRKFSDEHRIGYALLSDIDSSVIRSFGILNTNIAPGMRSYGIPHPVEYLVSSGGVVLGKYFVPNYQHRVSGSEVALLELGARTSAGGARLTSGPLTVEVVLSSDRAFAGQQLASGPRSSSNPGGTCMASRTPPGCLPVAVRFESPSVSNNPSSFPGPGSPGSVRSTKRSPFTRANSKHSASCSFKFPIDEGGIDLAGTLSFQLCSDTVCERPDSLKFKLVPL